MDENNTGKATGLSSDPFIFFSVLTLVIVILFGALINIQMTGAILFFLQDFIVGNFSWLFSLTVTFLLLFSIWLACSRFAHVKLGGDNSKPDFSLTGWLSMLFSAGMGIGLVFFGVAEPVLHFVAPPVSEPETSAAAREAMRLSIFHWGLHAWAIYVVLGLALALSHFRFGAPLAIRSTLQPVLGDMTHRWPGKVIDMLAVLGTLFGLATSLGLGAAQINAGLSELFQTEISTNSQVLIIILITFFAIMSLVLGLDKGIRRLSEFNMVLAVLLLTFILILGPTAALLRGLPDHLGNYLQNLPGMSLSTHPFQSLDWQKAWTIFYWAWWLSWAPFVGTFIARISKGRTIREFVIGVLVAPTLMGLLWFGIFGGAALRHELLGGGGIAEIVEQNSALAIYALLAQFPLQQFTNLVAIILVAVFFITSSDSGSFVVDMLTSGGDPNPPVWQRIFWASMEGMLAIILLIIGGLGALQAGAISLGLPFCIIILVVCYALQKRLKDSIVPI